MKYFYETRQIHIVITTSCNLQCSYCYEHNKYNSTIDVKQIKGILKKEVKNCDGKQLLITYHGGEPLLQFNVVKELSEWLWLNYGENIKIAFVTNGTVLTNEIREWIWNNRHRLWIVVSIDGLPDVHNLNRCNSFDKIDLDFFLSIYEKLPVKMTVHANSISKLFEGFEYLYNLGCMPDVALAAEIEFTDEHVSMLIEQLNLIIGFYATHYDLPVTEFLFFPFERLSLTFPDKNWKRHRCGIENSRMAIDTHGHMYPCQTFISDFNSTYSKKKIMGMKRMIKENTWEDLFFECYNCYIREICSPCYGLNYSYRGGIDKIDDNFCKTTKIVALASATLWTNILLDSEKYLWLKNFPKDVLAHRIIGLNEFIRRLNGKV